MKSAPSSPLRRPGRVRRAGRWLRAKLGPEPLLWRALPRPALGMLLLGLLTRQGFPPVGLWIFTFAGIVAFTWYFAKFRRYVTPRVGFWLGFFYGFGYFYSCCFWLNNLIAFNALAPLGIVAMAAILALWFGAQGAGMAWIAARTPAWLPLATAALWTLSEWARGVGQLGFSFFRVAHLFWRTPEMAAVWGELGYTFVAVLACAGVAFLLCRWWALPGFIGRRAGERWLMQMGLGAVPIVLAATVFAPAVLPQGPPAARHIAMIQPAVAQSRKMAANMAPDWDTAVKLGGEIASETLQLAFDRIDPGAVDLIVFPEATFPGLYLQADPELHAAMRQLADMAGAPILAGSEYFEERPDRGPDAEDVYNATLLFEPGHTGPTAVYRKRHLVPFGEDVPYLSVIPYFQQYVVGVGTFDKGRGGQLFSLGAQKVGVMICFESSVAGLARESRRAGADLLVVMTNDAWFGESSEQHFHMIHGAFRAVETGVPLIQAANTGISVVFDQHGRLLAQLPPYKPGVLIAELPDQMRPDADMAASYPIYLWWGDSWLWALVLALGCLVWRGFRSGPDGNGPSLVT